MDGNASTQNGTPASHDGYPWSPPEVPSTPTQAAPAETMAADPRARRRRRAVFAVGSSLTAMGVAAAVVIGVGTIGAGTGTASLGTTAQTGPTVNFGRGGFATGLPGGFGSNGGASSASGTSTATTTSTATADQQIGVVDINTVLGYQNAEAAGTGMVLTSAGEILTNNHVVSGATSIRFTVVSSGATYTATVVGTDPTDDIAVLQLAHASGLQVADVSHQAAQLGDAVTAVGNAGGTGGTPSAASGTVTALNQSITATDETGSGAEHLTGLIQTDAAVQPGDSGGPLYDSASGKIVGIDTAASSGAVVDGYAIPISTALSIAGQIVSGVDNSTIDQGYPAFLGVSVVPTAPTTAGGGAAIAGVLSGGPAQRAGLSAGDVITAVGGTAIGSSGDLTTALAGHAPGDTVRLSWTDAAGASHSASVTLATGPAA
jgi:S1-C subfamily serine protease